MDGPRPRREESSSEAQGDRGRESLSMWHSGSFGGPSGSFSTEAPDERTQASLATAFEGFEYTNTVALGQMTQRLAAKEKSADADIIIRGL